jgi:hypothetical protein
MPFSRLTVGQSAVRLVADDTARYLTAIISCETAAVRWRVDGGAPDAQTGHLLAAEATLILESGVEITQCQFYCPTGTAVLQCTVED